VDAESYIDTNVFIYWLGNHPNFDKKAHQWIKKVEEVPRGKYATSSLMIYQTLTIMAGLTGKNLKDQKLAEETTHSITSLPGPTIIPLTQKDITQATSLMKEYELDYEDAIHLAAALKSKAKEIISNDQDFDKTTIKRRFT
jgi:predicted nucleic acid-binding protein